MRQMPIAIVGRGCVLPGAHSPRALWQRVQAGDLLLGPPPSGAWPTDSEVVTTDEQGRLWSDHAGFVDGFRFDPAGFRIDAEELLAADRCAQWVLEATRQALAEASLPLAQGHARTGAILGHLSLPPPLQARYAISTWMRRWADTQGVPDLVQALDAAPISPTNRYMSALPTRLLVRGLGLGAEAYTVDAACASSLYALKLACDALEDGRADVMLAGASCGTDPMFLHIGFRALKALSPTGQSRPFHREANGLVHAEGAAVFVLKRLADARAAGDRVLGILRGIGLSNDGGAAGLLVPHSGGQVRSMRGALQRARLSPRDVSLMECHATGTPVGDGIELASITEVYGEAGRFGALPIGSIKSQVGHLLTASGAAGLLKLLGAFEAGVLPASRPVDQPLPALAQAPVRLLTAEEPWPAGAPRIAAVSSFGFGGNNAHVIVEADGGDAVVPVAWPRPTRTVDDGPLAIVGLGVVAAGAPDVPAFTHALLDGQSALSADTGGRTWGLAGPFKLKAAEIRFPPRDLADSLPQQVMLLKAASEALATVRELPAQRTGVMAGMECDAEISRQLARVEIPERLRQWAEAAGRPVDAHWMQLAADAIVPPLKASTVTGSLPNIVANRLNTQYRLEGPGHSVSADELSGLRALAIAARALRRGELDAALVAAVDLCCEPVSARASASLQGAGRQIPGDAAVVMVVKRLDDAQRAGETVLAVIEGTLEAGAPHDKDNKPEETGPLRLGDEEGALSLADRFGHAHAASGLLHVAAAVLACRHRASPGDGRARVGIRSQDGQWMRVRLRADGPAVPPPAPDAVSSASDTPSGLPFVSHLPAIELPPCPPAPLGSSPFPAVPLPDRNPTVHNPDCNRHTSMNTSTLDADTIAPALAPAPATQRPPGVLWTRADLEEMSHGQLSKFYGPKFREQDRHARQVRMPMPPLLMADRVISIEGEPGSMGLGRIVTETDVTEGAWYLHEGSMPAGLEVESGQADLLLISWLGADLLNRGERVYRLLGCEINFNGKRRPRVGDTIRYEIEVTGHANTGDVRLFFFRYKSYINGELRLVVTNGRAGFFTEQELENAGGVIWDAARDGPDPALSHDEAPPISVSPTASRPIARSYSAAQLRALAAGRPWECFGTGFEVTASHHRTPRIQSGDMQLIQEVEDLDPRGGPWGRGYLRALYRIQGDEWFFPGHFHNDPTMPGTLMCEAGVQMMSFYLAALGLTRARDGWRFEIVPGVAFKAVCRGQVIPSSRLMSYELLVRRLELGPQPTLWADVMLTVDGRKAFHGRNLGLRLVPDVPLALAQPLPPAPGARAPAQVDGFTFDGAAMLHCATGLPSLAFGPRFARFDGTRNLPRLPSEPYQFMSRVTRCEGPLGDMKVGSAVEIEYDIPADAWYFNDNDGVTMPFAVLLEAALQPCGWLAAYMGVPLHCDTDLSFRNLDGDGVLLRPLYRGDGILRTAARCTSISRNGDIFIESFDVECHMGDAHVYTLKTVFGHFTPEALADQKGLPATPADKEAMRAATGAPVDLLAASRDTRLPRLAHGNLLMLDRVVGHWPQGGSAGKGRLLAEFDVKPTAWFFKAHFYRDPVQPGSLGIEAMIQLLQHHMRERGMGREFRAPRFEPLAVGHRMAWKYRGQVLPRNQRVSVEMDITEEGRDPEGPWLRANAWLWVDGLRIYQTKGMTMRVVEGG